MGRMNEKEIFQEDTPPNVILSDEDLVPNNEGPESTRSKSPIIQINESNVTYFACSVCIQACVLDK